METITISGLDAAEIETVIALAHRIWHAHYPGIITTAQIDYMLGLGYTPQVIADEIAHKGIIWLSIKREGTMIGFISVGPHAPQTMKLHKLYLLPEYHGAGIGARALAEVERIARDNGATGLVLNVNRHNVKAIRAYERAGWTVAEEVVVDIGNGFVMDDYVMAKPLG